MGDKYTVVELDTLGGDYSEAFGINKNGQIVGRASRPMVGASACLWQPWSAYDVLGLGAAWTGPVKPLALTSSAAAINTQGKVVGWTQKGAAEERHALLYDGGAIDLSSVVGKSWSQAVDINAANVIVGGGNNETDGGWDAFVCDLESGTVSNIGGPGIAKAVNDSGQVAGVLYDENYGGWRAFVYHNGQLSFLTQGPGTGNVGNALDINNDGNVVGEFNFKPFIYNSVGEVLKILDVNGMGIATAINDVGQVVGYSSKNGIKSAWLYIAEDDEVVLLDDVIPSDVGWKLNEAHDINFHGRIVGVGQHHGKTRGFLLVPLDKPTRKSWLPFEAAIDPVSLILSGKAYEIWLEIHHPHEPKERIQEVIRAMTPDDRTAVLNRATILLECGKSMEARADYPRVHGVAIIEELLVSMAAEKREVILNRGRTVLECGNAAEKRHH